MTTNEVANRLVELCRGFQFETAMNELYADNIVSVEPDGAPVKVVEGLDAVKMKGQQFQEMCEEMHGMEVTEPVVAKDHFSVAMKMDVTFKGGMRTVMDEIALYQVENGKIIREEFFFVPMQPNG